MGREQQIIELIRRDPFISQLEIAEQVGLSRSAVAGHIASLIKKGILLGRAYVMAENGAVLCIGGANLDSKAIGKRTIRPASSNPVDVTQSCGGVARNIAENLAKLSCRTFLLTLVGDDKAGEWLLEETRKAGVDTSPSLMQREMKTGAYTAVLNPDGEMALAFADMAIYDLFSPRLLQEKWPHIAGSQLVIADTNPSADSLAYLIERCRDEKLPLFVDPVSSEKAKKLPERLEGVTAIFPNLEEACELAGVPITDEADAESLAAAIHLRGAEHVFVTLGKNGVAYGGAEGSRSFPVIPTEVVEVTGAGDAFVAGIAYGILQNHSYSEACRFGLAAAHLTLQSSESVSSRFNEEALLRVLEQQHDQRL
ncbi:carbohydrate kinase [Cohnella faecalis]|uniref:Winged helix-turn-helix transcriptional regulator n=1 Tax=Cohnella faecalis TaxID=2315694 RepID=A0A398CLD6_9BACL|nr:carbohydrate kinase [Cohnella faecalis]RIE03032.1 winged helix-turn-helix transcriptional regulator [Cohnella faecalis]